MNQPKLLMWERLRQAPKPSTTFVKQASLASQSYLSSNVNRWGITFFGVSGSRIQYSFLAQSAPVLLSLIVAQNSGPVFLNIHDQGEIIQGNVNFIALDAANDQCYCIESLYPDNWSMELYGYGKQYGTAPK